MQQVDELLQARWVLPIQPEETLLEHHTIVVHQGRILDLLPSDAAKAQYQGKITELPDHIVLPGLVNAHAHSPMSLFRGLADDLPLMTWLQNHMWPAEGDVLSPESIRDGMELAMAEMIRGGTTCFNEHYFYPKVIAEAVEQSGMRALIGLIIMSVPTGWAKTEEEYFEKAESLLDQSPPSDRIQWALAPHAPYTVSDNSFRKIKQLSDKYNLPVHIHLHETDTEVEGSLTQYKQRPFARLESLGLVNERLIAVHMVQLTAEEIRACHDNNVSMVHCPESNLKLGSGIAPLTALMAASVNVALGTDGAASNNDLDMWGELRTASFLAKGAERNPSTLPAFSALKMATLNGAKALGMEKEVGSIETGKQADLIAIDLN